MSAVSDEVKSESVAFRACDEIRWSARVVATEVIGSNRIVIDLHPVSKYSDQCLGRNVGKLPEPMRHETCLLLEAIGRRSLKRVRP